MALVTINWNPDRRQLQGFGTICVLAFSALGAWVLFRHSLFAIPLEARVAEKTAYGLWALAGLCLVLRLVAPSALRPIYYALTAIGLPIGYAVSHILLAALFYGLITPIGLLSRLVGHDPLNREFRSDALTYWVPRTPVTDVKRYYRQF